MRSVKPNVVRDEKQNNNNSKKKKERKKIGVIFYFVAEAEKDSFIVCSSIAVRQLKTDA